VNLAQDHQSDRQWQGIFYWDEMNITVAQKTVPMFGYFEKTGLVKI
jgi:hypothetical protein